MAAGSEVPNFSTKGKRVRRRWGQAIDIVAVHAARAADAHVAPRGQLTERFERAAKIFNAHPQTLYTVDAKMLKDHFHALKNRYLAKDKRNASQTGVEEHDTELNLLLRDVVAAAVDHEQRVAHEREEADRREAQLVADGESIRHFAMERRRKRPRSAGSQSGASEASAPSASGAAMAGPSMATSRRHTRFDVDDDTDVVEHLQQSEKRREELAMKQMEQMERRFEQEREFHKEEMERRDRVEAKQREERDVHRRLILAVLRKLE